MHVGTPALCRLRDLWIRAGVALCAAAFVVFPLFGATIREPNTGITVTVAAAGTYTIQSLSPEWTFSGTLPSGANNIRVNSGRDNVDEYQEIAFDERNKPARHFAIRTWSARSGVLFTQVLPQATANPPAFPLFTTHPAFAHEVSFGGTWSTAHFDLSGTEGPWAFFDDGAETAILSPAANFMVARLSVGAAGELGSRIDGAIAALPTGHCHATLLVIGQGINRTFDSWGRILTDYQGKVRPANDADATLKYLGYWTDNGAAYYYNFDPARGYEGTMLGVRDDFRRVGLPLGYMQLDSWWYRKGSTGDWNPQPDQWNFGISTYEAHPDLFPQGLASFSERLGLPLVTHARWIDVDSPYRTKYAISNNVAVDPQYWSDIAAYLKQSGVRTYEQDWLDSRATAKFELADQDAFMDNMAHALADAGITMQYCMPTPRHVLQGSKYSNLTTVRVSDDRFERKYWPQVIYASRLAASVGAWPWVDVFASSETANLIIATLSAGVVGASDAIGAADAENLRRAARPDGVLVKPDAPLVPTDSTFINEAENGAVPVVAYAYSEHQAGRAVYVFAFKRGGEVRATFTPAETGLTGTVFAWNARTHDGTLVKADAELKLDLSQDWSNLVLVPVTRSGIAFVGDTGKYVPLGRTRFPQIADRGEAMDVDVSFAAGEGSIAITGYSTGQPQFSTSSGDVTNVSWNPATGMFTARVHPATGSTSAHFTVRASHPRRRAT